MSKKSSLLYLVVLACTVFTAVIIATADLGALAQNTNSSTTTEESMQNTNAETVPTRRGRRGRRGRRSTRPLAADANMSGDDANVSQDTAMDANLSARTTDLSGEQTDLSGTYTGNLRMTGSHEMSGEGTITINGNTVTIESGGMTHNGRIFAITTRGYTGVTMYFPDLQDSVTNTGLVVMSRARKRGNRLMLTPVPGARNVIAFR